MKIIFSLYMFLNCLVAQAQWTQELSGINDSVDSQHISVVNNNESWAYFKYYQGSTDSCLIFKKGQMGWKCINGNTNLPRIELTCIIAKDSNSAWFGTIDGKIYRTLNGGVNWNLQVNSAGPSSFINAIKFSEVNPNFGIAYSDPPIANSHIFKIYKTRDNGISWMGYDYNINTNYVGLIHSLSVTDSNHIYLGLSDQLSSTNIPKIAYTTNGGTNWNISSLPSPGIALTCIAFMPDNMNGMASIQSLTSPNYIIRTTNGGINWINQFNFNNDLCYSIVPIPGTHTWYRCDVNGGAWKSTNNGVDWFNLNEPISNDQNQFMDAKLINGIVYARFLSLNNKIFLYRDSIGTSGIGNINEQLPRDIKLLNNYPNPFNPGTHIDFELSKRQSVKLYILDINGKEIELLKNETLSPGNYSVYWNASNLPSSIYFAKLQGLTYSETIKIILIK